LSNIPSSVLGALELALGSRWRGQVVLELPPSGPVASAFHSSRDVLCLTLPSSSIFSSGQSGPSCCAVRCGFVHSCGFCIGSKFACDTSYSNAPVTPDTRIFAQAHRSRCSLPKQAATVVASGKTLLQ
jgi:hypothetical protein